MADGVEVGGVDPDGIGHPERHLGEHLPVARRARQTARDVIAQLVERGPLALARGERRGPADVHVSGGGLDLEKRGVERGKPIAEHWSPLESASAPARSRARLPLTSTANAASSLRYRTSPRGDNVPAASSPPYPLAAAL